MPAVTRWTFHDPYDPNPATATYVVPLNPKTMTSPWPTRAITNQGTTAVDGQTLFTEGAAAPADWTFGGTIVDAAHYEALRSWVYGRRRRVQITDHYGRVIVCILQSFTPTPKRGVGRYWLHDYEIKGLVISVGAPTA